MLCMCVNVMREILRGMDSKHRGVGRRRKKKRKTERKKRKKTSEYRELPKRERETKTGPPEKKRCTYLERIICRELNGQEKDAAFVWAVTGTEREPRQKLQVT